MAIPTSVTYESPFVALIEDLKRNPAKPPTAQGVTNATVFQQHLTNLTSPTGGGLSASGGSASQVSSSISGTTVSQISTAGTQAPSEDRAITAVRDTLKAEGIDPSTVHLSVYEETAWYPGGNWVDRYLRAETPDGRRIDFSARLSERSPQVSVTDIRHMLNRTGGWGVTS